MSTYTTAIVKLLKKHTRNFNRKELEIVISLIESGTYFEMVDSPMGDLLLQVGSLPDNSAPKFVVKISVDKLSVIENFMPVEPKTVVTPDNANLILTILRNDKNFTQIGQLSKVEIILETSRYIDPYKDRIMISDNINNYFTIEKSNKGNVLTIDFDGYIYEYTLDSEAFSIINSLFKY